MKRFSIFLVAMLVAVSASAQLVTSSSSMTIKQKQAPKPKEDRCMWILRAGIGVNGFNMSDDMTKWNTDLDNEYKKAKFGYNFDWSFNRKMGNKGAYWGMNWGFGSRGYKVKVDEDGAEYKYKHSAHNIYWVPFNFGWKIQCGDSKVSIDPHLGVYMAVDYAGKIKEEWDFSGNDGDNDWSIWDDYEEDYMPFDMGLKLGVGVWFNDRFNVDLTYQRGFVQAYDVEGADYDDGPFTNNFMVSVGIGF